MDGVWMEVKILGGALIALVLGGLVGLEREAAGKWAGIRTHMLVCLASFLFVRTGELIILRARETYPGDLLQADPVRILEAIMTGIAFIGAGTIFRDRTQHAAKGLTTAASLLTVAPIGVAVALEYYILAAGATLIGLFVLRIVFWGEQKIVKNLRPADSPPPEVQEN